MTLREHRRTIDMKKDFIAHLSGISGREIQHAIIDRVGREYIHFTSLHAGCKSRKVKLVDYYRTGSLYEDAVR